MLIETIGMIGRKDKHGNKKMSTKLPEEKPSGYEAFSLLEKWLIIILSGNIFNENKNSKKMAKGLKKEVKVSSFPDNMIVQIET